ncbi:hypothetical protein FJY84_04545, partial [Candidatus Bathyarchaeota archaeon]|nr:hypothetical protein [Candidatus Bathyarchaeota archaeon]
KVTKIDIEAVVKGLGVENLLSINAYDLKNNIESIKQFMSREGVKAIVSHGPCALYNDRKKRSSGVPIIPNKVSIETCKTIYACVRDFYCPAIELNIDSRQTEIQLDVCNGCMSCAKLCPVTAISSIGGIKQ